MFGKIFKTLKKFPVSINESRLQNVNFISRCVTNEF